MLLILHKKHGKSSLIPPFCFCARWHTIKSISIWSTTNRILTSPDTESQEALKTSLETQYTLHVFWCIIRTWPQFDTLFPTKKHREIKIKNLRQHNFLFVSYICYSTPISLKSKKKTLTFPIYCTNNEFVVIQYFSSIYNLKVYPHTWKFCINWQYIIRSVN